MFEIGSWKWKLGLTEISITTPEMMYKFPYPIIAVQFGARVKSSSSQGGKILCNLCPKGIAPLNNF